ncbi:MAG: hypothetical protein HY075_14365 [Deltaproteobacteria bacterium]|nr:hypothetical protein [Deltaproteobacteria bacterium]
MSHRLDWCLTWENTCGCAPAEAFCKRMGYGYVASFEQEPHLEAQHIVTALIGERDVYCPCQDRTHRCDGYAKIVCSDTPVKGWDKDCPPAGGPAVGKSAEPERPSAGSASNVIFDSKPPKPEKQAPPEIKGRGETGVKAQPRL